MRSAYFKFFFSKSRPIFEVGVLLRSVYFRDFTVYDKGTVHYYSCSNIFWGFWPKITFFEEECTGLTMSLQSVVNSIGFIKCLSRLYQLPCMAMFVLYVKYYIRGHIMQGRAVLSTCHPTFQGLWAVTYSWWGRNLPFLSEPPIGTPEIHTPKSSSRS